MDVVIDSGAALGGRLTWVHLGTNRRNRVQMFVDDELRAESESADIAVIGTDVDVVYLQIDSGIVRYVLDCDGLTRLDPVPGRRAAEIAV